MSIRRAFQADQPRIDAIRLGVTQNVLFDPSKVSTAEVDWYREHGIFLVAEEAGDVVGFACGNHQTGLVWALFVDPAHEGRGHGRALLDETVRRLQAAGLAQAHLNTGANTRAARFYRENGWRDAGYALDGQVVFVKSLALA